MTNFSPSTGYVINGVPPCHNPRVTNDTYMYFSLRMIKNITWSYSEDPGYSGHPKNNSAITHPRDHISIASENGKPRITSGALKKKDTKINVMAGTCSLGVSQKLLIHTPWKVE